MAGGDGEHGGNRRNGMPDPLSRLADTALQHLRIGLLQIRILLILNQLDHLLVADWIKKQSFGFDFYDLTVIYFSAAVRASFDAVHGCPFRIRTVRPPRRSFPCSMSFRQV